MQRRLDHAKPGHDTVNVPNSKELPATILWVLVLLVCSFM